MKILVSSKCCKFRYLISSEELGNVIEKEKMASLLISIIQILNRKLI